MLGDPLKVPLGKGCSPGIPTLNFHRRSTPGCRVSCKDSEYGPRQLLSAKGNS